MRGHRGVYGTHWQSYADLAMALMAVMVLVMFLLLLRQFGQSQELATAKKVADTHRSNAETARKAAETAQDELARKQETLATELQALAREAQGIVATQDRAEEWLENLFADSKCPLELKNGALAFKSDARIGAASLYRPAQFRLSVEGQDALRKCKDAFVRLAYCLEPGSRTDLQHAPDCLGETPATGESEAVEALRVGIAALSLEGNTDMVHLQGGVPGISTAGQAVLLRRDAESFASNAYLGAERARQALGHLLGLLEANDADEHDALHLLMRRVRIESPSFGQYQAGPLASRARAADGSPACVPGSRDCEAARNLSLRIRWGKQALRQPFERFKGKFCDLLANTESALWEGLESKEKGQAQRTLRELCNTSREAR